MTPGQQGLHQVLGNQGSLVRIGLLEGCGTYGYFENVQNLD